MSKNFDVVIVGSGPGGYVSAIRASQLGMKTAIVERENLGGVCLNWGCIPTKALLKNAELLNGIKDAKNWGITIESMKIDFSKVVKKSRNAADRMSKGVAFLMRHNNIEHFAGTGHLLNKNTIQVTSDGQAVDILSAEHIILATGGRPRPLPGLDFDGTTVISSKEAMIQKSVPESLTIVGAGAIGVEFAYFFSSFGTKVALLEMLPQIMPSEDAEIAKALTKAYDKMKIASITGAKVQEAKKTGKGVEIIYTRGDETSILQSEKMLVAIGVKANTENMGFEESGIKLDRGFIQVDEFYKTSVDGIYAIGDCIGGQLLAHVASAEGLTCIEKIAGHDVTPIDYDSIPHCTYCQPQIASIGLTEEAAREQGYELKIGRYPFRANGKAVAAGESEGFVKLIFDAEYGELLGAHIIGHEATEMIAELGVAKTMEATYIEILKTIHAHPTMSEAVMEAAGQAYGEAIHI